MLYLTRRRFFSVREASLLQREQKYSSFTHDGPLSQFFACIFNVQCLFKKKNIQEFHLLLGRQRSTGTYTILLYYLMGLFQEIAKNHLPYFLMSKKEVYSSHIAYLKSRAM